MSREMVGNVVPSALSPNALIPSQQATLKSCIEKRSLEAEVKSCSACEAEVLPLLLAPTKMDISRARSIFTSRRRRKFRILNESMCMSMPLDRFLGLGWAQGSVICGALMSARFVGPSS